MQSKPEKKPKCPHFSSGPTAKLPGWNVDLLKGALVGRSHRSLEGKTKLSLLTEKMRTILEIPEDYKLGIMPASATGATECALWSLLGLKGVDVFSFDVFGKLWVIDIVEQLKLEDVRVFQEDFGQLPNLDNYNSDRDTIFTWNGTTSGTCIPNADWIAEDREGLTLCDATSAAFCIDLPWEKLDATAFSWQKGLGSEGGHGVLVLSPKAIDRLKTYQPAWPIPRLFRLTHQGNLIEGIFKGETINTPSMLCVEDCLKSLEWCESIGGLKNLIQRCQDNFKLIEEWVKKTAWVEFMSTKLENVSPISVCLVLSDLKEKEDNEHRKILETIGNKLEKEQVAYEIVNHLYAPPSLRIWCGPTVESKDIEALLTWLEWAYTSVINI